MAGTPSRPTPPASGSITKMTNQAPFKPTTVPSVESKSQPGFLTDGEKATSGRS